MRANSLVAVCDFPALMQTAGATSRDIKASAHRPVFDAALGLCWLRDSAKDFIHDGDELAVLRGSSRFQISDLVTRFAALEDAHGRGQVQHLLQLLLLPIRGDTIDLHRRL